MKKIRLFLFASCWCLLGNTQDLSNMGTDFWTGFGYHSRMKDNDNSIGAFLSIYVAAGSTSATVRVSLPGVADPSFPRTVNVPANTTVEITNFPRGDLSDELNEAGLPDCRLFYTGLTNRGIHIESTNGAPIAVFEHTYGKDASGATMLFPSNTWGASYNVLTIGGKTNSGVSNSFFFVMAAEDNTTVLITPTTDLQDSSNASVFKDDNNVVLHPAGVQFSVVLNKGQVFNGMSTVVNKVAGDLTGTLIKSTDCANKKIMVVAGNGRTFVNSNGCNVSSGSDNLLQQMLPRVAWGTQYLTTPTKTMEYGVYRICIQKAGTQVKVNGTPIAAPLIAGFYYQIESKGFLSIESDNPVMVVQYILTGGCKTAVDGNIGEGDPEMIILSPVQQAVKSTSVFSASKQNISSGASYINVIIRKEGVASFKIDNKATVDTGNSSFTGPVYGSSGVVTLANAFKPHPANPDYSFARFKVTSGFSHNMSSDSGFNAIAYGMVKGESYGYNAGTLIKDLTAVVETNNPYATVKGAFTCPKNPANLEIALPYLRSQVATLDWFPVTAGIVPAGNKSTTEAASWVRSYVQGVTTYNVYKAPVAYIFPVVGTYRINVTIVGTFSSECGGTQVTPIDVQVVRDTVDFTITPDGCGSPSVTFADVTKPYLSSTITKWIWDFGDGAPSPDYTGNTPATKNPPKHTFTTLSSFDIKLSTINSLGCISDTIKKLDLSSGLLAKFTITPKDTVCPGTELTFTDGSSGSGAAGTVNKWSWTFKKLPSGPTTTATTQIVKQTYAATGTYEVTLQVNTTANCPSNIAKDTFFVAPEPVANFMLPAGVCIPGTTVFPNTSTLAGGTTAGVTWDWDYGDASAPAVGHTFDGTHVYTAAGPYTVCLKATSPYGCSGTLSTKCQTVKDVFEPPVAGFKFSGNCLGSAVQFTDTSKGTGQKINGWYWDFGDGSDTAKTGTPKHFFDPPGTYTVRLAVTSDKGCRSDTVGAQVVINPLPVPGFTLPAGCLEGGGLVTFTNTSTMPGGTAMTYSWTFGDAAHPPNTSVLTDGQHDYSLAGPGTYAVGLTATSAAGCASAPLVQQFVAAGSRPAPGLEIRKENGLCANSKVELKDTTRVGIGRLKLLEIIWDLAGAPTVVETDNAPQDGKPGSSKVYSHQYPASATAKQYTVRIIAYSGQGCSATLERDITVNGAPDVVFPNGLADICLEATPRVLDPSTAATETTGLPGTYAYSGPGVWNGPGGTEFDPSASGGANTAPGYLIKVVYTTTPAGCADSATAYIRVLPTPVASWETSSPVCETNRTVFTSTSTTGFGSIAAWSWDFGDGTFPNPQVVASGAPLPHAFPKAGQYPVRLTVTTAQGCTATATLPGLTVHYLPVVKIGIPGALCLPDATGSFTDKSTIGDHTEALFRYLWEFGDGTTSEVRDPKHTYGAGVKTPVKVQLVVTSSEGCVDSLHPAVELTNLYPPPAPDFSADAFEHCLGQRVSFTDLSDGVTSGITKWSWLYGDGRGDTVRNPSYTYARANLFTVRLSVENGQGCRASVEKQVRVSAYPKIELADELWVHPGGSLVLQPKVGGVGSSGIGYQWSPALYLSDATAGRPVSRPQEDILYHLEVTAGPGCRGTDSVRVRLLQDIKPPNAFSPNGDGVNDTWAIPNLENYGGCLVEVFDRYGRLVHKQTGYSRPWDGMSGGRQLPTAVYYYIIHPENGYDPVQGSVTIVR